MCGRNGRVIGRLGSTWWSDCVAFPALYGRRCALVRWRLDGERMYGSRTNLHACSHKFSDLFKGVYDALGSSCALLGRGKACHALTLIVHHETGTWQSVTRPLRSAATSFECLGISLAASAGWLPSTAHSFQMQICTFDVCAARSEEMKWRWQALTLGSWEITEKSTSDRRRKSRLLKDIVSSRASHRQFWLILRSQCLHASSNSQQCSSFMADNPKRMTAFTAVSWCRAGMKSSLSLEISMRLRYCLNLLCH